MEKSVNFLKKNVGIIFLVFVGLILFKDLVNFIDMLSNNTSAARFFSYVLNDLCYLAFLGLGVFGLVKNKLNPNNKMFLFVGVTLGLYTLVSGLANSFSWIRYLASDSQNAEAIDVVDDIFNAFFYLSELIFIVIIVLEYVFNKEIKWSPFVVLFILAVAFVIFIISIVEVAQGTISWIYIISTLGSVVSYVFLFGFYYFYKEKDTTPTATSAFDETTVEAEEE